MTQIYMIYADKNCISVAQKNSNPIVIENRIAFTIQNISTATQINHI